MLNTKLSTMRKFTILLFSIALSTALFSCKQDIVNPYEPSKPIETSEPSTRTIEEGSGVKD